MTPLRIGIVAESFLPTVNGVSNSILRVLEYAHRHGHQALVIAPGARDFAEEVPDYLGFPVHRVPTVMVPRIDSLPIGVPGPAIVSTLRAFRPDIVHLASPFVLGAAGAFAARRLGLPAVAIYQTDIAGFATRYRLSPLAHTAWAWTRYIHNLCQRTLAPSTTALEQLAAHGVRNIYRWGRGVDAQRFHPRHRSEQLRRSWDPTGRKYIIGFIGRLAAEKGVARLQGLAHREDLQLVIVGDGPERAELTRLLPDAVFTGQLGGTQLAAAYASLDVFVHTGEFETFCQAIQEAQASGVPTIAPRAGGPIDLIEPGHNGLLLPVANFAEELSAAVSWVLEPARHTQLAEHARRRVAPRTWEAQCAELMAHYQAVISTY